MIIDAHQHFWALSRGDYDWLTPQLECLYRDFLPADLKPHLDRHNIVGTVLVQAAPTVAETEYLLQIADETPFVLGVVGWVDFEASTVEDEITRLTRHPKLVGLRPMIQSIEDEDWMLRPDIAPAFNAMIENDLVFDALVLPRHLANLKTLLSRYPNLRTVIDHGAKPEISTKQFDVWAKDIAEVANETNVYCKLSGLATEAPQDWNRTDIAPYVDQLLRQFGADRLIWGSDWPVLTLASDYDNWIETAKSFIQDDADIARIFRSNAIDLYKLNAT